jgi:hypothetical protein
MKNTKLTIRYFGFYSFVLAGALLGSGCATHHPFAKLYLHEYSPTVQRADATKQSPLRGVTVSVKDLAEDFDYNVRPTDKNVYEPQGWIFSNIGTNEVEKKLWNQEYHARIEATRKADWKQIGFIRNGVGVRAGGVFATVPPGIWLAETLRMDLAGQGAQIVQDGDAQVSVRGTIRYLLIELCYTYMADLVVDVEITVRGQPTIKRTLHTTLSTYAEHAMAGSTTSFGFFKTFRQCQQKFSAGMIEELEQALSAPAAAAK